jgi:hypothetical protein
MPKYIKTRINIFFALIGILTFSSCVQYKLINIQTLKPSELVVPSNFSRPLVIAGIYKGIEGVPENLAQAALDSTAALEAAYALVESLYESPWYSGLNIPVKAFYRDESSKLIIPYPWNRVEQITKQDSADLLISLEYIKVTPKTDAYPYWDGNTQAYYGYLSMNLYAYWRIYDLTSKKVYAQHLFTDTLEWEKYDYSRVKIGNQLPGFFAASAYCGNITGLDYAARIAPTWVDEQRLVFIRGSQEMAKATVFAANNQWFDAAAQWQLVIQKPKQKVQLAAKAAFNMAVANEMVSNFDVALEWLSKSYQLFPMPETLSYRKIIEHRIKQLEKL